APKQLARHSCRPTAGLHPPYGLLQPSPGCDCSPPGRRKSPQHPSPSSEHSGTRLVSGIREFLSQGHSDGGTATRRKCGAAFESASATVQEHFHHNNHRGQGPGRLWSTECESSTERLRNEGLGRNTQAGWVP